MFGTMPCAKAYTSITAFEPDIVISAGTAGGFRSAGGEIGDVYLSTKCVFHSRRIMSGDHGNDYEEYGFGNFRSPPVVSTKPQQTPTAHSTQHTAPAHSHGIVWHAQTVAASVWYAQNGAACVWPSQQQRMRGACVCLRIPATHAVVCNHTLTRCFMPNYGLPCGVPTGNPCAGSWLQDGCHKHVRFSRLHCECNAGTWHGVHASSVIE